MQYGSDMFSAYRECWIGCLYGCLWSMSPEWLYFIDRFSGIFWKPFWRLHRLSVYLEEDMNPALSGIGITCPACYMLPICNFWQCFVVDSCVFCSVQTMKPCFRYKIDQKSLFSSMFLCWNLVFMWISDKFSVFHEYSRQENLVSCEVYTRKLRFMSYMDKLSVF